MSTETGFIDGAQDGLSAHEGMKLAIGGGEKPKPKMRPDEIAAYLLGPDVPITEDGDGYNEAARRCGKFILLTLTARPEIQQAPVETEYDFATWNAEGENRGDFAPILRKGWDQLLKEADPVGYAAAVDGISGFMWGFAVNQVRYVLGLNQVRNPAIIEISVP